MSTWTNPTLATLKVRKANSSESFTFVGVSSKDTVGTPDDYLDAVNDLLDIAGLSAVKSGMTRTVTQEVRN